MIVANPRQTKYDRYAHQKLRYQPGTERALLNGLMQAIFEEKSDHSPYLPAEGLDEFKENLKKTPLKEIKETTGVLVGDIREAARVLANAQAPAIIFGNDLLAQAQGKENAVAVADLFLLIGQPGNPGSALYPIAEKNNTHGVCDTGVLPDMLPGYQKLDAEINIQQRLEQDYFHDPRIYPG